MQEEVPRTEPSPITSSFFRLLRIRKYPAVPLRRRRFSALTTGLNRNNSSWTELYCSNGRFLVLKTSRLPVHTVKIN